MTTDLLLKTLEEDLSKTLQHLQNDYAGLQIGRASASMVERLVVDVYGSNQPLKAVANISIPDARTVQIQPWDRSTLVAIEKAIMVSDLGLSPQNDGVVIRLNIPPLTEERRKELGKVVYKMAEEAKIAVRNLRHTAMEEVKKMKSNNDVTEDQQKSSEKRIQEYVDKVNKEIETSAKSKEEDVLKV